MANTRRMRGQLFKKLDAKTDTTAREVAPLRGEVGSVSEDGRIRVITNGADCVLPADVRSASPGDGVVVADKASRDGIAQAPPSVVMATGPRLRPEIISADPDVWNGAALPVVLTGRFLLDVLQLELRLPAPNSPMLYPGVTVDSFEVIDDETIDLFVTVDHGLSPVPATMGGVAIDRQDVLTPRYLTSDVFEAGVQPIITSLEPAMLGHLPAQVTALGANLTQVDQVFFEVTDGGIPTYIIATVDDHPDPGSLTLGLLNDDDYREHWPPGNLTYGVGNLDLLAVGIWQALVPDRPWLMFEEDGPQAGAMFPPIGGAGYYANFGEPAVIPDHAKELPGSLPSTYTPPGAGQYMGRPDFQYYPSDPSALLSGAMVVMAERGDALPDGFADSDGVSGTGSNVWIAIHDLDADILRIVLIPAENRLLGTHVDANGIWAVTYLQGSGAQLINCSTLGEDAANNPGSFDVIGARSAGAAPLEMIGGNGSSVVCVEWTGGFGIPTATQSFAKASGVRTIGTLTTPRFVVSRWRHNSLAGVVRGTTGSGWRMANVTDSLYPVFVTISGANVTETAGWPNVPLGGGILFSDELDRRCGTFTSMAPTSSDHMHVYRGPRGKHTDVALSSAVVDPDDIPLDYDWTNQVSKGNDDDPRGSFPPGTF
jgi:hypothetical protein